MPLRLVVDNHQIEQAQFSDYLSLKSKRAFKNAESGHRSIHARILSDIQPSKISLGDRQCGLRASVRYCPPTYI